MRADITTGLVSGDQLIVDVHRATLNFPYSKNYLSPLSAPGVSKIIL